MVATAKILWWCRTYCRTVGLKLTKTAHVDKVKEFAKLISRLNDAQHFSISCPWPWPRQKFEVLGLDLNVLGLSRLTTTLIITLHLERPLNVNNIFLHRKTVQEFQKEVISHSYQDILISCWNKSRGRFKPDLCTWNQFHFDIAFESEYDELWMSGWASHYQQRTFQPKHEFSSAEKVFLKVK